MKLFSCTIFGIFLLFFLFSVSACKTREVDYIPYYKRVVEIDSIYRLADRPKAAVRKYRRLFRKYEPRNQDRIEEYATYITLADRYNMNFGGEKSLRKLIRLLVSHPNYDYHNPYYQLIEKYGIDNVEIDNEITRWRDGLNKEFMDSFSVAMERDSIPRLNLNIFESIEMNDNYESIKMNDSLNFELLKWTFKKYGYPSQNTIDITGGVNISIILIHLGSTMSDEKEFDYLKNKVWEYVKSGDCPPTHYAQMIDFYEFNRNNPRGAPYGLYTGFSDVADTLWVNKNRKSIGLPSIEHGERIILDFSKKAKKYYDSHPN